MNLFVNRLYLLLFFLPFVFCSCLTTRKVDHWVETHYKPLPSPKIKAKDKEYISVTPDITQKEAPYSTTIKGGDKLIPALFYWKWQKNRICTLSGSVPVSNFTATVFSYANTKNLREKLNGSKLELTVDQYPGVFTYKDYGWMVFVVLWVIGREEVFVDPENKDLVVSYRIVKEGSAIKNGTITIPGRELPVSQKLFQGTEKMVWKYLDQYDNNIKAMSKLFIDQLLTQLE